MTTKKVALNAEVDRLLALPVEDMCKELASTPITILGELFRAERHEELLLRITTYAKEVGIYGKVSMKDYFKSKEVL